MTFQIINKQQNNKTANIINTTANIIKKQNNSQYY